MNESFLSVSGLVKRFGKSVAVDKISFELRKGEVLTLLGPSGCGKTTTLRLVAGLETPDEGEIFLEGQPIASEEKRSFLPPEKRNMGMVFQSYAIWPHLTVFENVAFPLRVRREPAEVIQKRVREVLELVGLSGLEGRGSTQLSGGQQQRLALARALVYAPAILLLDEPLSNLDAKLREQMRFELKSLQKRLNLSVLYVTHDQAEAMTLSDRIAVIHQGRLEQLGTPTEIYENPATPFVGDFLGQTVIVDGVVREDAGEEWIDLLEGSGRLYLGNHHTPNLTTGQKVRIISRPEDVDILPQGEVGPNQLRAKVEEVAYLGDHLEYSVSAGGRSFVLSAAKKDRYPAGLEIRLVFDPDRVTVLSQ